MSFAAADAIRLIRLLEDHGVPVWVDAGWGIDALVKRQVRDHLDLDLITPVDMIVAAEAALAREGFAKDCDLTSLPTRLVLKHRSGLQVDFIPVKMMADGTAEHTDFHWGKQEHYTFTYSAGGLSGYGVIDGRAVHCTTAHEQVRTRIERRFSPWKSDRIRANGMSADIHDLLVLREAFGVQIPDWYLKPPASGGPASED